METKFFIDIARFMRSMIYYCHKLALNRNESHITLISNIKMIDAQAFTCVEFKYHNCNKMGGFHIVMLRFVYGSCNCGDIGIGHHE